MKLSAPPPPPPEPPEPPPPGQPPEPNDEGKPGPDAVAEPSAADALAPKPEPKPATWPAWFGGIDVALAMLAVGLAFLLGSFVARNSDLWLHLGTGKMLAAGQYTPGSDPLSYTAADRPWVNHSWLFDLGAYLLYKGDGLALVLVKTLVVAAAFGLLLGIRRPDQPLWPWAILIVLASLACAPRLTLTPLVGSIFFLAVTLVLLFRVPSPPGSWRLPVGIGVTFWFWANVDAWFVLGPLTLGLLLIGELVRTKVLKAAGPATAPDDPLGPLPDVQTLARALLVGVVACMLNPHHVRVWQIPFELIGSVYVESDPRLNLLLSSPLDQLYRSNPNFGENLNGLAYALLLVAGVVAVGLSGVIGRFVGPAGEVDPLPLPHAVLWVGFALLSLKSVYAIPFLAVVTVPLVASRLNVFSGRVTLGTWGDRRTRVALFGSGAGRVLSVLVLLGLCVAAYPGWLHPPGWQTPAGFNPAYARRVAWAVEPDPTLAATATRIDGWRASGKLPEGTRGLITSMELANYCAWYAPREKVFVNSRFNHHRPELPQFVKVRRGLGLIWGDELPDPKDVAAVLEARDIGYVGIATAAGESETARATAQVAGRQTWVGWENWAPWHIDGRTTISGWRPAPGKGGPAFDRLRVDPAVLAFGPGVKKLPAGKVEPLPPPRTLLDDFTHPVRPGPPDAEDVPAWVQYRQVVANRQAVKGQVLQLMLLRVVPRIGGPPLPAEVISANTQGQFAQAQPGAEVFAPWPPPGAVAATPVLALRAARRAVAANPDHPDGYFALAVALEDSGLPISDGERTAGIVTAFRQCLSRMPPPAEYRRGVYAASPTQVSARLAELYLGRQLRDGTFGGVSVDLPVLREMIGEMVTLQNNQIVRFQYQPAPGALGPFVQALDLARTALAQARDYAAVEVPPEKREETVKNLAENLKKLDAVLIRATGAYQAAAQQPPAARYRVARRAGLTGEAITLLKELIARNELEAQFKQDTQRVALELIALELATGRLEDAADDIEGLKEVFTKLASQPNPHPDLMLLRGTLRYMEYHKLVLEGNYAGAGAEFEELNGGGVGKYPTGEGLKAGDLAGLNPRALDPRPYLIFGPAWPAIGSLGTTDSPLGLLVRHQAGYVQVLRQMAIVVSNRMREDAEFFFRRGFLSLLEGDMPAAKERFRQATRPPPPGWDLPTVSHAVAADYLRVIEAAEQRAAAP